VKWLVVAFIAIGPRAPDLESEIGRSSGTARKQLGRFLDRIRGDGLEAVHQKAVAVIVVVDDLPHGLSGRQPPVRSRKGSTLDAEWGSKGKPNHKGLDALQEDLHRASVFKLI
jgi:hypothetical protein